jgi:hypothetical protein
MTTNPPDADIDLKPILGVIARAWQRIHPLDLTADEAFSLLTLLLDIENRIENGGLTGPATQLQDSGPKLRVVR